MAKDDFTVKIEDGRIMFMTSYRDEFGEQKKVANIISKERLIEIRDNINRALEQNNINTQLPLGDVMRLLPERGCCMGCANWRYTQNGMGDCKILKQFTDEGFDCKAWAEKDNNA